MTDIYLVRHGQASFGEKDSLKGTKGYHHDPLTNENQHCAEVIAR